MQMKMKEELSLSQSEYGYGSTRTPSPIVQYFKISVLCIFSSHPEIRIQRNMMCASAFVEALLSTSTSSHSIYMFISYTTYLIFAPNTNDHKASFKFRQNIK